MDCQLKMGAMKSKLCNVSNKQKCIDTLSLARLFWLLGSRKPGCSDLVLVTGDSFSNKPYPGGFTCYSSTGTAQFSLFSDGMAR